MDYNYTNTVGWLGFLVKLNIAQVLSLHMAGLTSVKYTHWNHFMRASDYNFSYVEEKDEVMPLGLKHPVMMGGNLGELYIEADPISTSQVKGGVLDDLGDALTFWQSHILANYQIIPLRGSISA